MSAELLREAASLMGYDDFERAVADWLEVTATDVGTSTLAYHAAVKAARAYLGRGA